MTLPSVAIQIWSQLRSFVEATNAYRPLTASFAACTASSFMTDRQLYKYATGFTSADLAYLGLKAHFASKAGKITA